MSTSASNQAVARNAILNLLSDAEIAKVSNKESKKPVAKGETFIDLEHLDLGVQNADGGSQILSENVIPKSAVSTETWDKIVAKLQR